MNNDKVYHQINEWLINKVKESGTNGFVVGVSGGIDSAVTSTLCALTGYPTTVVAMPINKMIGKEEKEHIDKLILDHENVDGVLAELSATYSTMMGGNEEILGELDEETMNLVRANLQSRLRMAQLYVFANANNALVVGTGNKVEDFGVGFFTKYGDGGVDISPIADLLKSEVRELGQYIGISDDIINAAPTDGLWEDERTDEDQLGLSYEEIEDIMVNGEKANVTKEKYDRYWELHNRSRHKVETPPICEIKEKNQ